MTTASAGDAQDFGDLTSGRGFLAAGSNSTKIAFAGGNTGSNSNIIDKITIASTGNATDFGDLTGARQGLGGAANGHGGLSTTDFAQNYFSLGTNLVAAGDIAIFGGGATPSASNVMEFITISSAGNGADFGDMESTRYDRGTVSSTVRGLYAGGGNGSSPYQYVNISAVNFAAKGNVSDFGDLTSGRTQLTQGTLSNNVRGVFGPGYRDPAGANNVIDFVTIPSAGNATDFGDRSIGDGIRSAAGMCSPTRALFSGGRGPSGNTNTIDFISFASTGNASDFGDLTETRFNMGGMSSSTRGVTMGGNKSPALSDVIDFVTIASAGNAQDFGDLSSAAQVSAGVTNNTRGTYGLGNTGSISNVIEFITMASAGDGTDFGDLTAAKGGVSVSGNGHGGTQ